jgi:hypothetical protein
VDDSGRSADERGRREHFLLVFDQDGELTLEDVERIRVLLVEVRFGSGPSVREKRLRDAELFEVGLDHDPPAEERFALAGCKHHSVHRRRV